MTETNLKTTEGPLHTGHSAPQTMEGYSMPPVDIYETEDGLTLLADMPGLNEKSLHVSVEKGILTIEGHAAVTTAEQFHREFNLAGYWRQFQLPDTFDVARARADMKDGVLSLHLPKTEAARPKRIEVTVN